MDLIPQHCFRLHMPDFRPLRANHHFKLKFSSATKNIQFKHSFFIRIIDKWNNLPKEIAEAENLNTFKKRLRYHLANFSSEHQVLLLCNVLYISKVSILNSFK